MDENSEKRKVGRPATGTSKSRQLGRVPDAMWAKFKRAAELEGKDFSVWAIALLQKEANSIIEKNEKNE